MAKTYYVSWPSTASGDPRGNFGLTPTFLIFNQNGTPVSAPGISNVVGATGIYSFIWGTTTPICFLIDGFTTGLGSVRYIPGSIDPADSINEIGSTIVALGTTSVAIGTSGIALGTSAVALGITAVALGQTNVAIGTSIAAIGTSILAIGTSNYALGITILSELTGSSSLGALIGTVGSTFGGQLTDPIDLFGYLKRVQENLEGDNYYSKAAGLLQIYNRGSSTLLRDKNIANGVSQVTKTGL
jgi:hypothetical protein